MWVPGNIKVDDLRRLVRKTIGNCGKRIVVVADNRTNGSVMLRNLETKTTENIAQLRKEFIANKESGRQKWQQEGKGKTRTLEKAQRVAPA